MITRREFLSLPVLGGWFDDDPVEVRLTELEDGLEATKEVLGLTIEALQEVARIVDNNTAYFERRLADLEARLAVPPAKGKTQA